MCLCVCVRVWFGLVSLFDGMSSFVGYLMLKTSFLNGISGTIQPIAKGISEFMAFIRI